jgi:hypothetical protein
VSFLHKTISRLPILDEIYLKIKTVASAVQEIGAGLDVGMLQPRREKDGKYLTLNSGFFRVKLSSIAGLVKESRAGESSRWLERLR